MSHDVPDILVLRDVIDPRTLRVLVDRFFSDMVKLVLDVEGEIIAIGGELHADAEAVLLEMGSRQQDLWGANYYPARGPGACVEYTALINIRPSRGNRSMEIEDPAIRERVRALVFRFVGRGEPLP